MTKLLQIRVDKEWDAMVNKYCKENNLSKSDFIRDTIYFEIWTKKKGIKYDD